MNSAISIILPTYNRMATLERAIKSVLLQSFSDWTLLIVDDASTDGTSQLDLLQIDPRIRYHRLDTNRGTAFARNYGIGQSASPFLTFLDSDDEYDPNYLEGLFNLIAHSSVEVGFAWCGSKVVNGRHIKRSVWEPDLKADPYLNFLRNIRIGIGSGVIFKKIVFDSCGGFNDQLLAAEDTEFFFRIAANYPYTYTTNILLTIHRGSSGSLTRSFPKIADAYNHFIGDHWNTIVEHADLRIKYFYKLSWLNFSAGYHKLGYQYAFKLLKEKPLHGKMLFLVILHTLLPHTVASKIHFIISANS